MFTTENGAASLILKEIPARGIAYIKILSSLSPKALLGECVDFCRACGAEAVFAAGECIPQEYPVSAVIMELQALMPGESDAALFPVSDETVGQWRSVYNERMADVPNASYMTKADEKQLLKDGDCYFVHRDGVLLGIGKASGDRIEMLASVKPGCGETVLLALASLLQGDTVRLTVARENARAMRLYGRLGFVPVREVSRWHKIL